MGKITIRQYLTGQGYSPPVEETYDHISNWMAWYQNEVKKFHEYKVFDGVEVHEEKRYRLGMAKKVCEDWANLILNEKVAIKAGDYEQRLNEILDANNFRVRGNQLIELAFGLGTGAFVEYLNGDKEPVIDYVRADMIYPLSYDNNDTTECAFGSYRSYKGKECIYLQIHRFGKPEEGEDVNLYYIENQYVDLESGLGLELPENMLDKVCTGSKKPLFQIITPNMVNNIDPDSPMGISVFANAVDEVKGCDLVYDSYMNEFILGRKRILVPISMAKAMLGKSKDGQQDQTQFKFDPSETVFYQMPADRNTELQPTEIDMSIRAQEHELGIQRTLDLCSFKCGLGAGRFRFDSSGVKTATEIISDKSDLFQNLKKNEITIRAAIIHMVQAVAFLDGKGDSLEVTVDFDDSIIEDSNTTIDRNIKLVNAGLRSKRTAIMEINKYTETEAEKELKLIADEAQITGTDIDWTNMDKNPEDKVSDEP
ncbi:MAG: phage portal protein [Fusicatenibacter sp.]|nr:phage portal protein [Fusicatenibacter sp.]